MNNMELGAKIALQGVKEKINNIPEEMAKLRTILTAMSVHWYDDSETFPIIPDFCTDINIYRTKYKYKGSEYSVICGHGTYGGDKGLLEVWISKKGEPTGWHTADDIIAMMKGEKG